MNKKNNRAYQHDQFSGWKTIVVIVALLVVWAVVLAVGAIINDSCLWRPMVIVLVIAVFAAIWTLAITLRKKR